MDGRRSDSEMKSIILGFLLVVIGLSFTQVFAAEVIFDSSEKSYSAGDIVNLEGVITGGIEGDIVAIEVKSPSGDVILLRTVELGPGGSYSLKFRIPPSGESGTYGITTNIEVDESTTTAIPGTFQKQAAEDSLIQETVPSYEDEIEPAPTTQPSTTPSGGGCLIATATYGSELAPQVQQLRELRDNQLLQTESGTGFMSSFNEFYYSFSPTIADLERQHPVFKEFVKLSITPLITSLSILNYVDMNSEAEVLGYGISLIILNLGMYFVAPAIVLRKIIQKN